VPAENVVPGRTGRGESPDKGWLLMLVAGSQVVLWLSVGAVIPSHRTQQIIETGNVLLVLSYIVIYWEWHNDLPNSRRGIHCLGRRRHSVRCEGQSIAWACTLIRPLEILGEERQIRKEGS